MAKSVWVWEDDLKRYRSTTTGQFIGVNQMQDLRVDFLAQQKVVMQSHVEDYLRGDISIRRLEINLQNTLKETYIDMYSLGAGGRNNLSQRDWGKIGAMLKKQYGQNGYMKGLLEQINSGQITPAQANARLKMYVNSANQALWKGITRDMPELPAYPGDGSTVCLTNCQCTWEIVPVEGGFNCYWRLGVAEHCEDCVQRSQEWNPLFVPYGV